MIKLCIIDDHQMFTEALGQFIRSQKDMKLVGIANNLSNVEEFLTECKPDILLLDLQIRGENSIEKIDLLKRFQQIQKKYLKQQLQVGLETDG